MHALLGVQGRAGHGGANGPVVSESAELVADRIPLARSCGFFVYVASTRLLVQLACHRRGNHTGLQGDALFDARLDDPEFDANRLDEPWLTDIGEHKSALRACVIYVCCQRRFQLDRRLGDRGAHEG